MSSYKHISATLQQQMSASVAGLWILEESFRSAEQMEALKLWENMKTRKKGSVRS